MSGSVAVSVPPRPQDTVCDQIVRHEVEIAMAVRARMGGIIGSTLEAVMAAANDETANLTTYGIPLTAAEVIALGAAGVSPDPVTVMTLWTAAR